MNPSLDAAVAAGPLTQEEAEAIERGGRPVEEVLAERGIPVQTLAPPPDPPPPPGLRDAGPTRVLRAGIPEGLFGSDEFTVYAVELR